MAQADDIDPSVSRGASSERIWLPLNALRAFEAVGMELSFTRAAAALHTSQSALSRHVARLEELIGCRLLERRRDGVQLTAAGAQLLPVLQGSFDRIESVLQTLRRDASGPRILTVHMPPTFLQVRGVSILRDFRQDVDDVVIDVYSRAAGGLVDGGACDLAVSFDRPRVDDKVRDLLWSISIVPACAPDLAARAKGQTLAEFLRANELAHTKIQGAPFGRGWADYARHHRLSIGSSRGLSFDTEALAVQWAIDAGGVILVDPVMWAEEFEKGRLVAPFDAPQPTGFSYYLTVHPDDLPDPAIALFRNFMIERFAHDAGRSDDR